MSSMPPATTGVAMGSSRSGRPSELDADAIRDTPGWPTSQAQAWGTMAARPSERRTRHRCRWDSASVCWAIAGAAQCAFGHGEVVVHQVEFGVHDVVTWLLEKRDYLPHTPGARYFFTAVKHTALRRLLYAWARYVVAVDPAMLVL